MNTKSLEMGRTEWLLLLLLASLWGSSFLLMKIAVQELPVFTVTLGRIGIAAVLMTLYIYICGYRLPGTWRAWGRLVLLGFLRASLPLSLFVWASTQIDSQLSGILNSTTPLFAVIVAHLFTKDDRFTPHKIAGVLCGMAGVTVLIGFDALLGLGNNVWGQVAVLAATCSYGFAGVYGRQFKAMPVPVSTAGFLIGATLLILPLALFLDQPWTLRPSWIAIGAVTSLALFNTAIAFMVWLTLILRAGATNTAQVTFIIPVIALFLGWLVLGEQLSWNAALGLSLILLGLAITQKRVGRWLFQRRIPRLSAN